MLYTFNAFWYLKLKINKNDSTMIIHALLFWFLFKLPYIFPNVQDIQVTTQFDAQLHSLTSFSHSHPFIHCISSKLHIINNHSSCCNPPSNKKYNMGYCFDLMHELSVRGLGSKFLLISFFTILLFKWRVHLVNFDQTHG